MKLSGPACTEAMSGAEESERRERAEDNAGGVRVERRVRHARHPDMNSSSLVSDW
jgi:hypothetical protein